MRSAEVCARLGISERDLNHLLAAGLRPTGGGGGQRGHRMRWEECDLPSLAVCAELLASGASIEVIGRVTRALHGRRVVFSSFLVVGHSGRYVSVSGSAHLPLEVRAAGEAAYVLDLSVVRARLRMAAAG